MFIYSFVLIKGYSSEISERKNFKLFLKKYTNNFKWVYPTVLESLPTNLNEFIQFFYLQMLNKHNCQAPWDSKSITCFRTPTNSYIKTTVITSDFHGNEMLYHFELLVLQALLSRGSMTAWLWLKGHWIHSMAGSKSSEKCGMVTNKVHFWEIDLLHLMDKLEKNNLFYSFKIIYTIQWCIAIIEVIEGIFKYLFIILNRKHVLKITIWFQRIVSQKL